MLGIARQAGIARQKLQHCNFRDTINVLNVKLSMLVELTEVYLFLFLLFLLFFHFHNNKDLFHLIWLTFWLFKITVTAQLKLKVVRSNPYASSSFVWLLHTWTRLCMYFWCAGYTVSRNLCEPPPPLLRIQSC